MLIFYITIADKIREFRAKNNMSMKDFGKMIGVSAQAVCKWEKGTCYPDIILLPCLARILNCTTDDFFNSREEDKEHKDFNA